MGKRGTKPMPTSLKIMSGEKDKRRLNHDEPVAPMGIPEAPDTLTGEALSEWDRMTEILDGMGILSPADRASLIALCEAWGRYVDLSEKYKQTGPLTKTSNGNIIQNPILGALNKAQSELRRWLVEFGLTPSSRSTIKAMSSGSDKNQLLAMLKARGNAS